MVPFFGLLRFYIQGIPTAVIQNVKGLQMVWVPDPRDLVEEKLHISMEQLQMCMSIGINDGIGERAGEF